MMSDHSIHEPPIEAIRDEAYRLYLASGRMEGRDRENWFLAQQKLEQTQSAQDFEKNKDNLIHFPLNANAMPTNTPNPFPPPNFNENAS